MNANDGVPEPQPRASVSLKLIIEDKLKTSQQEVFNRVVGKLTEKEIELREKQIIEGLIRLEQAERAVLVAKNIKPDKVVSEKTFNNDGTIRTEEVRAFSENGLKEKVKKVKEAEEALDRIDKALELAFSGDYSKLRKVLGNTEAKASEEGGS